MQEELFQSYTSAKGQLLSKTGHRQQHQAFKKFKPAVVSQLQQLSTDAAQTQATTQELDSLLQSYLEQLQQHCSVAIDVLEQENLKMVSQLAQQVHAMTENVVAVSNHYRVIAETELKLLHSDERAFLKSPLLEQNLLYPHETVESTLSSLRAFFSSSP
jgi:hypothetical protein